ncbi:MAG TPA: SGNH/GDSL hydrolase family protein [Pyrinomonadaceae bacterium]|nr:SGNH/GDSL hydrolase family protein [Acidobacteriota bacterium]HQZ95626.1 SGNH/GDSL hydrolase family protein [Pyrinomonadaceae bacterium]
MVVQYLQTLQKDKNFSADVLLVNCGLHDIKSDKITGKKAIELAEYKTNLMKIRNLARTMKMKLIWINSTPVNDDIHNSKNVGFFRDSKDVEDYNQAAKLYFEKVNVPIIDLNSFSRTFPSEAFSDHVHYRHEYVQLQAAFIAGFLTNR